MDPNAWYKFMGRYKTLNNHLLHNLVCVQVIEEAKTEKTDKVFIQSIADKCNIYNKKCSKLRSAVVIHVSQRRWSYCHTRSKMPSISRTLPAALNMRATRFFRCPHKK